jgi:hypothetical protein
MSLNVAILKSNLCNLWKSVDLLFWQSAMSFPPV